MRRWIWLLLALVASVASGQRLTTFAWDAGADWPTGTTVELCGTGDVCQTGITGTQGTLLLPVSPGEVIQGMARAIPPPGYQCGEPLALCPPSEWATVAQTWPAAPTGRWAWKEESDPVTVSVNLLTSGRSSTSGTSYNTASVSVAADRLQFLVFHASFVATYSSAPNVTVSGQGRTWTLVASRLFSQEGANYYNALYIYRAVGSATTGALTVSSPVSVYCASWDLFEWQGMDAGGTNGANAIVQTVGALGTNTTPSVTLASFGASTNAAFFVAGSSNDPARTATAGTNLTELTDHGVSYSATHTYWRNQAQTALSATLSGTPGYGWGAIGVEIRDSVAAASLPPHILNPARNYAHLLVR
jgi:hypothetical protein